MDQLDLAFAGITRQAELIGAGELSSRELVGLYLRRIAELDPRLNAFTTVLAESAMAEAERIDRDMDETGAQPLRGVPIAVKDNHDVAGVPTAHGTGVPVPPAAADCELVRRLRAAGAVVIGKTTLPELALYPVTESAAHGVTRNPWNLERTPGGSSGGSGAAVAAGLVGAATASDGGGSIRIPAANCGIFGLKPQRDRVSLAPLTEHWHGLTAYGCLARTVRDTALFLDSVADGEPLLPAADTPPGPLRIAISRSPIVPAPVTPAALVAVDETAELLRTLGHRVEEHDVPWGTMAAPMFVRYASGAAVDARQVAGGGRLERRTRAVVRIGQAFPRQLVAWARAQEKRHAARVASLFADHDVVLSPVTARPPVEVLRWEGVAGLRLLSLMGRVVPFTSGWNFLGTPAASVPAGFDEDGLPRSVQLAGPADSEPMLVSLSAQIEAERPWAAARPDLT